MLCFIMLKTDKNQELINSDLLQLIELQKVKISSLNEQLEWLKRQLFGQKSERFVDEVLDSPELPGFSPSEIDLKTNEEYTQYKRKKGANINKGTCTLELPDDLPIEEIIKDIPQNERIDQKTGEEFVEIGREFTDKLAYKPEVYFIKRTVYIKYAVKGNSLSGVIQAPADDSILKGSKFDESFMAHVITEKLAYHSPLYRQQEKLSFNGIRIERQTLSSLVKNIGVKLEPLYNEMKKVLFQQQYIFSDDTPVNMLDPGKGKTKETRMWIYEGACPNGPAYKLYEFTINRKYEQPKRFLNGFKGIVHADAYGAYVELDRDKISPINWAACWVHARRYFEKSEAGDMELRNSIMRKIRDLFRYERLAWKHGAEVRLSMRQKYEKPIVESIYSILKEKITKCILLPKEKLTKAINYLLKYEENFRRFLDDPNIRMENNTAERAMRKIVLGKKNWMFIGSPTAGKSMGMLYSFVQTCRGMKIDPQKYLQDIFKKLMSHPHKNLHQLLPDQWIKNQM